MSAIPKKKLCWNCEGNVSREVDNCPYCGVYIHSNEHEEENYWNPAYTPAEKTEEVHSPLYQAEESELDTIFQIDAPTHSLDRATLFKTIREDLLPILLLMSGSVFFLFGLILFLFAREGSLTLQWKGSDWIFFALLSLPCMFIGWRMVSQLESKPKI